MTDAQKRFCDEYLIDLNATRAYKVAYPRCKKDETANAASSRMLRNVKVQEYISEKQKEIEERTEVTQDMVIRELAAIAFSKASDYAKLEEQKKALSGIKEGKFGIQVDSCDKVKALELLGKHLGMFSDVNVNMKNAVCVELVDDVNE